MYEATDKEIFDKVELKKINEGDLSYYNRNRKLAFPTRIIDLSYLCGQAHLIREAKSKIEYEFIGPNSGHILNQVKRRCQEYKRIMRQGKQRFKQKEVTHYDLDENKMYLDTQEGTMSFKYGPLRAIQFSFAKDFISFIKQTKYKDLTIEIPKSISDRIFWIEATGITNLSRSETTDLVNSYKYFLWLYHIAQFNERFHKNNTTDISLQKKEISERIKSIDKILKKPVIKIE
jgi:predicted RNA-binding protein